MSEAHVTGPHHLGRSSGLLPVPCADYSLRSSWFKYSQEALFLTAPPTSGRPVAHDRQTTTPGRQTEARRALVSSRKRSSRCAARPWTPKASTRAAANSIASGIPSSFRQISATIGASASLSSNSSRLPRVPVRHPRTDQGRGAELQRPRLTESGQDQPARRRLRRYRRGHPSRARA